MGVMIAGVDVASYQGYPDWHAVASSGYDFAITKATEGINYINPTLQHNWWGLPQAGMLRGAYHYAKPSLNTPTSEAEFFYRVIADQGLEYGDVLALDIEEGSGNLANWVLGFVQHLESLAGFKPLIYTSPAFVSDHGFRTRPELGEYGLWLASWSSQFPAPPPPWDLVAFWQDSDDAIVPGIDGPVDHDWFNGDRDLYVKYGYQGGSAPPVEPPYPPGDALAECRNLVGVAYHEDGIVRTSLNAALDAADKITSARTKRVIYEALSDLRTEVRAIEQFLADNNPDK